MVSTLHSYPVPSRGGIKDGQLPSWDLSQRFATEGWGTKINDRLSSDLQAEFPGVEGFSPGNFLHMRALAEAWPELEILQSLIAKLH